MGDLFWDGGSSGGLWQAMGAKHHPKAQRSLLFMISAPLRTMKFDGQVKMMIVSQLSDSLAGILTRLERVDSVMSLPHARRMIIQGVSLHLIDEPESLY